MIFVSITNDKLLRCNFTPKRLYKYYKLPVGSHIIFVNQSTYIDTKTWLRVIQVILMGIWKNDCRQGLSWLKIIWWHTMDLSHTWMWHKHVRSLYIIKSLLYKQRSIKVTTIKHSTKNRPNQIKGKLKDCWKWQDQVPVVISINIK